MALTIESETSDSIELDEYLDYVAENVDPTDVEQVIESAEKLKSLSNNRKFLVEKFNKELCDWESFQSDNAYSSQTLALGQGKKFFVRANMWAPPANSGEIGDWESKLFAYSKPHDHNFSFLTVGYIGSGYGTAIYEYNPQDVRGKVGEKVNLTFFRKNYFATGKNNVLSSLSRYTYSISSRGFLDFYKPHASFS